VEFTVLKCHSLNFCVNSTASADKQYIFAKYSVLAVKFLQIPGGGLQYIDNPRTS